ncbi:hypothetical protein HDU97_004023 [Phlyctochytrium planicorne]|nr:hypothetical protein HDU97_004023 [Phlyctochytrium planicorne]
MTSFINNMPSVNTTLPTVNEIPLQAVQDAIPYHLSGGQGILGIIAMAIGGVSDVKRDPVEASYRLYKPTIFLAGLLIGACAGYMLLVHVEPPEGYPSREYVILFGSLGIGAIGAIGGFFLALFILGFRSNGLIESGLGRAIFIAIIVIICVAAAFWLERHVVIISTSFSGAYLIVFGIDCYAHVGFIEASGNFLSTRQLNYGSYDLNGKVIALAATLVVLGIIGLVVQYRFNKGKKGFHK